VEPNGSKSEIQCPHCGHFAGPANRCANCGMRLEKQMGLKLLRIAALAIAIGGLFLLHLYATHRELPLVGIGDITPVMNFATVRVQGVLESDARTLRGGSVLYVVDDGTGTLPVFLNRTPEGKLPKAGSRITVAGSLSVGAGDEVRMRAQSADQILVEPGEDAGAFVSELKLSDITAEQQGARMTVYGKASKVWKPKPGSKAPHKIVLTDQSGSLDVVFWFEPELNVEVGDELEIDGMVDVYNEQVQFKVWEAGDIQPLETAPADSGFLNVSGITAKMEKQMVTVQGELGAPRAIPGGVVYPLDDGSGTIEVLFWDKQVSGEERDALDEGVRVRITAPVVVYKGTLELVPVDVGGFQLLE
jgi:DNA/RNA endonuclease YhcR with UshA esterase domain